MIVVTFGAFVISPPAQKKLNTSSDVRVTTRLSTTRKPLSHLDLPSFVAVINSLINNLNSFSADFF